MRSTETIGDQAIAAIAQDRRVRRMLIMKWSALGDVALASAAMEDLHQALPDVEMDLNTLPAFAPLFAEDPRFKRVLAIDVRGQGLRGIARWVIAVKRGRYDAIVDLQSTDRSRLLVSLVYVAGAGPRYRIGNHRRWPYNVAPPSQPSDVHALEHLRATLAVSGIRPVTDRPVLHPGPRNRQRADALIASKGLEPGRFALLLPGCQAAGWLKRWGARQYAGLALALRDLGVPKVVVVGAAEDADECRAIEVACPGVAVNVCGETELLDLVPLAQAARLVVANDTGTAHIASAAGQAMVIVCGPTDPKRVRPAGSRVAALQADIWCRNCYRKNCLHHSCMTLVSPGEVIEALRSLHALDTG